MINIRRVVLVAMLLMLAAVQAAAAAGQTVLSGVRTSDAPDKVRIVFDVDKLPAYEAELAADKLSMTVKLENTINKSGRDSIAFNDQKVAKLTFAANDGRVDATIDLKAAAKYRVFKLANPNRIVIDIYKPSDRDGYDIAAGVNYASWSEQLSAGVARVHILRIEPQSGYIVEPALSNDRIAGLETVGSIAGRYGVLAAVNASYFSTDGGIIGLLKIDGEIVSTPELPRTALGIMPDGKLFIDTVQYDGKVILANGRTVTIDGVNCERWADSLILYNRWFADSTGTNAYGTEYVIKDGRVAAINANKGDAALPYGTTVLSAHGKAAQALAALKVGDAVKISEGLGTAFDKAVSVIGAGPLLVADGKVKVTSAAEKFLPDIAIGRAPRTALGIAADGKVLLVVVDGRQSFSIGMSLQELAQFMVRQGAISAMNFDGGGSSEMVVNGNVMNSPSDGHERRIGSALVVAKR